MRSMQQIDQPPRARGAGAGPDDAQSRRWTCLCSNSAARSALCSPSSLHAPVRCWRTIPSYSLPQFQIGHGEVGDHAVLLVIPGRTRAIPDAAR